MTRERRTKIRNAMISWLARGAPALLFWASAHAGVPVTVPHATQGVIAFAQHREPLWIAAQLLPIVVALLMLVTGLGARLRAYCARLVGRNWFWTVSLFACLYIALVGLITMPFDYYRDVVDMRVWGQSAPSQMEWLISEAVSLIAKLVVTGLFVWIPYAMIAKSPRRWWLYSTAALMPVVFFVLVAIPVWVNPLTTTFKPLADASLIAKIETLAARCGVSHIPVFVGGNDDTVVGLGPTNRIVLDKDIFKNENPDQIMFTVGHELKHYVENDNWKALALIAGFLLAGFLLVDRLGRAWIARGARWFGFDELADPASLPLIVAILSLFWLAVSPALNLFTRHIEHEADRFGLELTHENRAMGELFANEITQHGETAEWDTFFLILRATHPSNGDRIRFANAYRPWETGDSLVYGDVCKPVGKSVTQADSREERTDL
jgi:Zn-dependent protease with chaperone function